MPFRPRERDPDWSELVTVLRTGDPALLSVAKSLLGDAGIRSLAKGEGVQDLFGLGRVGTGFNVLAGPVELQVMREDREEAVALLAELTEDAGEEGLKEDGEEGGKVEIPASGDTLPGESPSNLLRTFRTAWWRRPIWIVPFILAAAGIIIAVVGTRKPRPIALPTPDLPATIFQSEAVGFFYKLVWAAEGGSSTHFPTVRSTSVVAANDSVLLEEWVVERSDGVIYYPVYALARNESAWVLGVGVAQDSMVTQSAVPRLRRRVAGVREP